MNLLLTQRAKLKHVIVTYLTVFYLILKWDSNHGPTNARLHKPSGGGKTGAWSAQVNDANQWIQVTFVDDLTKVTAIGIQGRYDYDQWVTKYKVSYSVDGTNFIKQAKVR